MKYPRNRQSKPVEVIELSKDEIKEMMESFQSTITHGPAIKDAQFDERRNEKDKFTIVRTGSYTE